MNDKIDVLAWFATQIASHKALSADAYHAQELPRTEAVAAAVAELIEAAQAIADNVVLRETSHGRAIRAALARVGADNEST